MRSPFLRHLVRSIRLTGELPPQRSRAAGAVSRREFLRGAALTGGAVLTGCSVNPPADTEAVPDGTVAVVGGGVAGLTTAYRLSRRGVKVHLYEASQRLGGRMWTRRGFNDDGMFCELGGELVDTGHREIRALADELGVGVQKLSHLTDPGTEYYHIDGRRYTDEDLIPAFQPLARRIAAAAAGLYDAGDNFTAKARELDRIPLRTWLTRAGRESNTPAWLVQALDIAYTTEYGLDTDVQSSLNFIDMISTDTSDGFAVYGESDEAYRVRGGSGALPDALARRIAGKVDVRQGHSLTAIADDGRRTTLIFDTSGGRKAASYTTVVLAVPFTILRRVRGSADLPLSAGKQQAIRELGWGQNAKAMFSFHSRYWRSFKPASNGGVFSDSLFEAWDTSRGQKGSRGVTTCFIGGRAARAFRPGSGPAFLDRLEAAFPGARAAFDGRTATMDWTHFAFSRGSFSSPLVGQYCTLYDFSGTPELGGRLIFAGEHTSVASPGYMNGGVESGERAAKEVLARLSASA